MIFVVGETNEQVDLADESNTLFQGSKPKYDNATFSDGAVMFRFPDGRFEAIFLAFASQRFPTRDDNGEATRDSTPLSSLVSNVRENGVVGRNQAFHRL